MALTDNIVAYYKLESTTTADDELSNYDGVNTGADSATGHIGDCYRFVQGNPDKVTIDSGLTGIMDGDFTISLWFNRDNTNTIEWFVAMRLDGGDAKGVGILTHTATNNVYALLDTGAASKLLTYTNVDTGSWHHIVVRRDGTDWSLWYDNDEKDSNDSVGNDADVSNATDVKFGVGANGAVEPYDGMLDELGFWERALTDAEIGQLYNSGSGLTYPFAINVTPTPTVLALTLVGVAPDINIGNIVPVSGLGMTLSVVAPSYRSVRTATQGTKGTSTISKRNIPAGIGDTQNLIFESSNVLSKNRVLLEM